MDERVARIVRNIKTIKDLAQFEANARSRGALNDELKDAIRARASAFGRELIVERTGVSLNDLSPAEERIVQVASEYVGIKKGTGKDASYTLKQLKNRGLIDAVEAAVSTLRPTQGFQTLKDAQRGDLSYENIVVDHPEEFSPRAVWFSRNTLGLTNDISKPPAKAITPVQVRTEKLLRWLQEKSENDDGRLPSFTNAEAAAVLGMTDMHKFGRVFGNIQSRIDFACYVAGLPPLGLAAEAPFDDAWGQHDRNWGFPLQLMQAAAKSRAWSAGDFDAVLRETERLPGQAHISWKNEMTTKEAVVKEWAFGLAVPDFLEAPIPIEVAPETSRNPAWSRDELILALDLYMRYRGAPPSKDSDEVAELSGFLGRMGQVLGLTESEKFRNANGVYMKMMNYMRFDPDYTADGRIGLVRGNKNEKVIWDEFSNDLIGLAAAAKSVRASIDDMYGKYLFPIVSHSWTVYSDKMAIKKMDKSSFVHDGTGIPKEIGFFFRFSSYDKTKEIVLVHSGRHFRASLTPDTINQRMRLFWRGEFSEAISIALPDWRIRYETEEASFDEAVEMRFVKGEEADLYFVDFIDPKRIAGDAIPEHEEIPPEGRQEGASRQVISIRYERDPANRLEAIRVHGNRCAACGFDFREVYGVWGDGYIEVHHLTPLADLKEKQTVNPGTDLAPLCANCHRMIHRKRGQVLSLEELRCILRKEPTE